MDVMICFIGVLLQGQRVIFSVIVCIIRGILARIITGFIAGIVAGIIKTIIEAILVVIILGKKWTFSKYQSGYYYKRY